jgi:hypothetical protein
MFRRVTILGGLFWLIDGMRVLVSGPSAWAVAQVAIGLVLLLGAKRYWAWIGRRDRRRQERWDAITDSAELPD